jgi:hypothetical protein
VSTAELLARLARLDARDRAWLLGELPPALRRELVDVLADDEPAVAPAPTAPVAPVTAAGWESLEPPRAAEVLAAEPAWLASAATRGADIQWRERLLQSMPAAKRREIEIADRAGRPLGARAVQTVLAACRERLAAGVVTTREGQAPKHGFAALVDQMRSRFA